MKETIFNQLKGKLIVSCQAEEGSPFNSPEGVFQFAQAALQGGCVGIRTCGLEKTKYLIEHLKVPIIGLTKAYFEDGSVCITGNFEDVDKLIEMGTPIVAVDGTFRKRSNNLTGAQFIAEIKKRHKDAIIMADISTIDEAEACYNAGADCVSTTLCGYTPGTKNENTHRPSLDLLQQCVDKFPAHYPIFAEGRYNNPEDASHAIQIGAWSVVVGSAITRPHLITQWFVEAINSININ